MTTPENDGWGIHPDKPLEPWELPGGFRRDCEPHRGGLLAGLGIATAIFGILSLSCWPLAPAVLSLGYVTCWLARRDLGQMGRGLMDPGGEEQVTWACKRARLGILCSLASLVLWSGLLYLLYHWG